MGKLFAIYNNDEELVCVGTSKQCAKFLETSVNCVYSIISRTKSGVLKGNSYLIYEVESGGE